MEYVRSPKLPPLVFEAQTCAKDAMLELGVCRWDHIVLGISARSHMDAATLRRALERMDAAWPEGKEHMAKLSVNAIIGLWARSTEVVYSVRSSSSELDGAGADFSQAFAYEGGMVWDFVYARRLLSNGTYRPIHDAVLGFEHCMVAKARRILDAPPRYLAQVKTDCLLTQRLPKRFTERLRALEALRHPDGTPVYRVEETKPLLGSSRAPRMAADSLLLTGLPGTGKTHLARTIVARLREQGDPWQAAQRAERRRGLRAQGLAAGERQRGTRRTSRRSRWRSGSGSR